MHPAKAGKEGRKTHAPGSPGRGREKGSPREEKTPPSHSPNEEEESDSLNGKKRRGNTEEKKHEKKEIVAHQPASPSPQE